MVLALGELTFGSVTLKAKTFVNPIASNREKPTLSRSWSRSPRDLRFWASYTDARCFALRERARWWRGSSCRRRPRRLPALAFRFVVTMILLGLPIATVLAGMFEWTRRALFWRSSSAWIEFRASADRVQDALEPKTHGRAKDADGHRNADRCHEQGRAALEDVAFARMRS